MEHKHSIFRGGASLHWAVNTNENNHNLFEQKVKTLNPGYCWKLLMTNMTKNKQKEHERVLSCWNKILKTPWQLKQTENITPGHRKSLWT